VPQKQPKETQKTPAGKEIPIPLKRDILRDLKLAAKDHIVRRTSTKK